MPAGDSAWVLIEDALRAIIDNVVPNTYVSGQLAIGAAEYAEVHPPEGAVIDEYVAMSHVHYPRYLFNVDVVVKYNDAALHTSRWRCMNLAQSLMTEFFTRFKADPTLGQVVAGPDNPVFPRVSGPTLATVRDGERMDWVVTLQLALMGNMVVV